MSDPESRWIFRENDPEGPFSVDDLFRMAKRGDVDHKTLFWSESSQQWQPLTGLMFDIQPTDLSQFFQAGIKLIEIIDSGTGEDCPQCIALTGKKFPLESTPVLPPPECTCIPWCRCVVVASQ
jgi:hypothetical protein